MNALFVTLLATLIATPAFGDAERGDFLSEFVLGRYHLIGKKPDAEIAYLGRVEIYRDRTGLKIKRRIGEAMAVGSASVESALNGDAMLLRMRFTENQTAYESTCLIQGDLDNYARLSCHRYRQDGGTRQPGLEALFHASGP